MLTSEAKQLLSSTVRALRARLLADIHAAASGRYQLAVSLKEARLDEANRTRRERLEAWLDEQVRAARRNGTTGKKEEAALRERFLAQAEKEAAATLLNRIVLLRLLEAAGLSKPQVATGGWASKGYRAFRDFAPGLLGDETEGYGTLLGLVFDELSVDLPGLYGNVGLTQLFGIPASTLREVVDKLDQPGLASAWKDDTTLGWLYQYFNDPEREALDAKIADGGKIEPHEIASKTQMFTERYMVEWLLQNSLGLTWLCMCKKHGWTADAEAVLPVLDARRAGWRAKRDAGEVTLDALMPIHGELEELWKYYVPQPLPEDAVAKAPESVRAIKLLDPACGSGHFLVVAFDLLAAMYREEARHRGETISSRAIAESVVENNLYGIDIDPRAVQIAAAALYMKAKVVAGETSLGRMNLVALAVIAPSLKLGALANDDPSLVRLRREVHLSTGIDEKLTTSIVRALSQVDHIGSLFKVDKELDAVIEAHERGLRPGAQLELGAAAAKTRRRRESDRMRATLVERLEVFLAQHSSAADLGLRLHGEQLASGVRFVRMAREGAYDVVVGNPPYQNLSKTAEFDYIAKTYPRGKSDLYAAFLERGLELVRLGGASALITMRGWMFLCQLEELRKFILHKHRLSVLADLHFGAFSSMKDVSVSMVVTTKVPRETLPCIAIRPVNHERVVRDALQPNRNMAGLLVPSVRYEFEPRGFDAIEGEPIIYWWDRLLLERYRTSQKLSDVAPVRSGAATSDNARFIRRSTEVYREDSNWAPYIKGAEGRAWCDESSHIIRWDSKGLQARLYNEHHYGSYTRQIKSERWYFKRGIAFTAIGSKFAARLHSRPGVFDVMGQSIFPREQDLSSILCAMNRSSARDVLQSLNPTIHFQVSDVERLPLFPVERSEEIVRALMSAFQCRESTREPSLDFRRPATSAWTYAQSWAQLAVDRGEGAPLPPFEPVYDPPSPTASVSFHIGVALGRFGANGEGILDSAPPTTLPSGILFASIEGHDSLDTRACAGIHEAWKEHGATVGEGDELRTYLRATFFDYHKRLYENRPIYFPLSSSKKSFVAFVAIHRWTDSTLSDLLADHLVPARRRLEGELEDLRKARTQSAANGKTEKRFTDVKNRLEELEDFIDKVTEVAERGAPPSDERTARREVNAKFRMDLDDGVMINSAAVWPLLDPQWKDPRKWWKELSKAEGKKDYDWAHLAARYFPKRVREKCKVDPSLGVAHGCFWELHPAKAYQWELRLQDEIREGFTIDEPKSDEAREKFLKANRSEARAIEAAEQKRREKKKAKAQDAGAEQLSLPTGHEGDDDAGGAEAPDSRPSGKYRTQPPPAPVRGPKNAAPKRIVEEAKPRKTLAASPKRKAGGSR